MYIPNCKYYFINIWHLSHILADILRFLFFFNSGEIRNKWFLQSLLMLDKFHFFHFSFFNFLLFFLISLSLCFLFTAVSFYFLFLAKDIWLAVNILLHFSNYLLILHFIMDWCTYSLINSYLIFLLSISFLYFIYFLFYIFLFFFSLSMGSLIFSPNFIYWAMIVMTIMIIIIMIMMIIMMMFRYWWQAAK